MFEKREPISRMLFMAVSAMVFGGFLCAGEVLADDTFEQLWFSEVQCDSLPDMQASIQYPQKAAPSEDITFLIELVAALPFEEVNISLDIESDTQEIIHHAALQMEFHRGRNQVNFTWCGSEIPCGEYLIRVSIDYSDYVPPSICLLPFSKVSNETWQSDVEQTELLLESIGKALPDLPQTHESEKLRIQHLICSNTIIEAQAALQNAQWEKADHLINYLDKTIKAVHAGIVFQNTSSTETAPHVDIQLENMEIRDGAFYSGGTPVFLFGAELDRDAPIMSQISSLRDYGLNFAVATISAGDSDADAAMIVNETLEAAERNAVGVAIQFEQESISGEVMDRFPELLEPGFVNLAHEGFKEVYAERLAALAGSLQNKSAVIALSIAAAPQFKFTGEGIRQQFIARVKEKYPDRIELNRLWKSHLADYDEIIVWGDFPEYSYQNRRPFQYEWQTFQREKIDEFLAGQDQSIAAVASDLPLLVTLPNNAFTPEESRTGINRETVDRLMDINGCAVAAGFDEELYAMNYPDCQSCYTLMRSYAPGKPILNMQGDIEVGADTPVSSIYASVQSALWESVISGANGMALPAESTLFQYPDAVEAYVTAAKDINRLAPVVVAFQQAPPDIAILFSEASKIMDDGVPHLNSARYAFDGASFAGYSLRFITESQIIAGELAAIKVLIIPDTPAVSDATFELLSKYVEDGGTVARIGKPIPYNERGVSRSDVIRSTANTIFVRGLNLPTEYLHAMDAAQDTGVLPEISRPINAVGYPIEGVRSRYVVFNGEAYIYIINLRKEPFNSYLSGVSQKGYDLIHGRDVEFPRVMLPLEPMLIRMEKKNIG